MTGVIYGRMHCVVGLVGRNTKGCMEIAWYCPMCVHSELPFADVSIPNNNLLSIVDTSFDLKEGPKEECALFEDYHSG